MRPFVFRAQAALDLRTRRDEEARRELAAASAAVASAERALEQAAARREQALADARQAEQDATDTATLVWYRNWISTHQRDIARCEEALEHRRADANVARERATRIHIDVRVLEKLKDRARRTYDAAVQREEQKAIDWLAVLRSTRQPGGREDSE
jgi:flagellar export protein FliJ